MDFETLANEHKDAVYRQMLRVCGNQEDAEDVLVEALLKAYRHLDQLRASEAFRGWLTQIARRVCWQIKSHDALLPVLQLSAMEADGMQIPSREDGPEQKLEASRMKAILHQAIEQLPPQYKEVYKLRDVEELSGEEVAQRLDLTLANMKSRLHRARALVRAELDRTLTGRS